MRFLKIFQITTGILFLGMLAGCGAKKVPMAPPELEVSVVTVSSKNIPITSELPGRLNALRIAQVRARATGILLKRLFEEGSEVKEGQVLFEIDPAPLKAVDDSARASLARAEATLSDAKAKSDRYKKLLSLNAVSKQDYDDALAAALQANADVETAQANLETADLNLGYASVTAPISGKIGEALVTEGALVSQTDATELAVIQQIDPIYFDFTESSTDILKLRSSFDHGQFQKVSNDEARVTLVLEDGTPYQYPGRLLFRDITVDESTGMVTLRAIFPNPQHILLPGMFSRVEFEQALDQNAVTMLQQAVSLGANGSASVMIVEADNKVEQRKIKLGEAIGDQWTVTDGLHAGDTVIVEGLQKVKPGMKVKTVAFSQTDGDAAGNP